MASASHVIPSASMQFCPLEAGTLISKDAEVSGQFLHLNCKADDFGSALRKALFFGPESKAKGKHVAERGQFVSIPSLHQSRLRTQNGRFPVAQSTCEEERNTSLSSSCQYSDKTQGRWAH